MEDYDFESIITEFGEQTIFEPFDTKIIFDKLDLEDIKQVLTILCDLDVIHDFQLGLDWSLQIFKSN